MYHHEKKTYENDYDTKRKHGYRDMEGENIDDTKLKFDKNSSENENIVKEYSLEEHNTMKVNYSGMSRLPSIGRSLVSSSGCLQSYKVVVLFCAFIVRNS